jgi:UDP-3-O-[3-hydroxymyristoyl] glucosamine N-acyltransferase
MNLLGEKLDRIDPDKFLEITLKQETKYLNLVSKFPLRQKISEHMDQLNVDRFSFFATYIPDNASIENGCFFYPNVSVYPLVSVEKDVIIHSQSGLAHGVCVASGCFISGSVTICGSSKIGKNCWIGAGTLIIDNISIAQGTYLFPRSVVSKDVVQENTVYKKYRSIQSDFKE